VAGDFAVWVSAYYDAICSDPGLAIFPSQNSWLWDRHSGRISVQGYCGYTVLFGQTLLAADLLAPHALLAGNWYTLLLRHKPSTGVTEAYVYEDEENVLTLEAFDILTPKITHSIEESFSASTALRFGIAADKDSEDSGGRTQFKNLRVAVDSSDPPGPTV
jgi:hypothetical protein